MHRKVIHTFTQSQSSRVTRRAQPLVAFACALSLGLLLSSCEDSTASPSTGSPSTGDGSSQATTTDNATTEEVKPDAGRLLKRASDRWDLIVNASEDPKLWIEVYDYEAPAARDAQPLSRFLGNKEDFHYDNPSQPIPLLIEGDTAYLGVTAIWEAGKHSAIGGQSKVIGADANRIEFHDMIETWKFVKGEWYFLGPAVRRGDFLDENPDIVRRAQKANEAAAQKSAEGAGDE